MSCVTMASLAPVGSKLSTYTKESVLTTLSGNIARVPSPLTTKPVIPIFVLTLLFNISVSIASRLPRLTTLDTVWVFIYCKKPVALLKTLFLPLKTYKCPELSNDIFRKNSLGFASVSVP